ncbi:hypothetical protein AB0C32_45715, partial [Streptosporangium sp. NPDC048865]
MREGFPPVHLPADSRPRVVAWSGRTQEEAGGVREGLAGFFATLDAGRFADAVAVLQRGRTPHPVRGAVVAATPAEAAAALATAPASASGGTAGPGVRFVFPSGGAGRLGASLYGAERLFSETMDVCLEGFERHGVDLYDAWLAGERDDDPVTFAVTYSLAATLTAWGVTPLVCTGEGVGELTAAAFSGTLELDEAIARVAASASASVAVPERASVRAPEPVADDAMAVPEPVPDDLAVPGPVPDDLAAPEPLPGHETFHAPQVSSEAVPGRGTTGDTPSLLVGTAQAPPDEGTIDCGDDRRGLLTALARLWTLGCPVDWVA